MPPKQIKFSVNSPEESYILANYDMKSIAQLADEIGYGINVTHREVNRVLERYGIARRGSGRRTRATRDYQSSREDILLGLRNKGLTARQIAVRVGGSKTSINKRFELIRKKRRDGGSHDATAEGLPPRR